MEDLKQLRLKFINEHRLGCCELYNWKTPARIEWEQTEEGKRVLKEQQAARRKKYLLDTKIFIHHLIKYEKMGEFMLYWLKNKKILKMNQKP